MRTTVTCLLLFLCLSGKAMAQQLAFSPAWSLRLPQEQAVAFRGMANFDQAGKGASNTTYMLPGIAGTVAAVAAHRWLINASLERQKSEIELEADQVLLPYRPVLDALRQDALMAAALARTSTGSARKLIAYLDQDESGWIVESTPLFTMTQDHSALVLDNAIAVYAPGVLKQASYSNTLRVVSRPATQADLHSYWNASQGLQLQETSAALLALSFEIALQQAQMDAAAPQSPPAPFRTVRYREGRKDVAERAQLLSEHCGRALIKNLRGWLMSVPLPPADTGESCARER